MPPSILTPRPQKMVEAFTAARPLSSAAGNRPESRRLTANETLRLVAWKVLRRARLTTDAAGGFSRLALKGERWAESWRLSTPDGLRAWLDRPAAGQLWIP